MKKSIFNGREVNFVSSDNMNSDAVHETNGIFWDTVGNDVVGATALPQYGAFITEDKHRLFGDVSGKKLLEIGCGSGESLKYHGEHEAGELWGMDISENQIAKSGRLLTESSIAAKFVCSPMEEECGIPKNYFDFVYSIYAVGWTTDLEKTFCRIASYLKKDGAFIFSWSHPIHKCVYTENDIHIFKKSYFDESRYSMVFNDGTLTLSDYKMSTYVNTLYKAGFVIEQMIEEPDDNFIKDTDSDHAKKARMIPLTFVIKAKKL
jgi:Methylase involved in ubiquinone/menaquinone biosynthesis